MPSVVFLVPQDEQAADPIPVLNVPSEHKKQFSPEWPALQTIYATCLK